MYNVVKNENKINQIPIQFHKFTLFPCLQWQIKATETQKLNVWSPKPELTYDTEPGNIFNPKIENILYRTVGLSDQIERGREWHTPFM